MSCVLAPAWWRFGVVAVDGTKIVAAATHHATRTYEQISKEILEDAARLDAAEDELFGDARGDALPAGLRTSGERRKWLREAKQAMDAQRAAQAKKIPRDRGERLAECKTRLEQDWKTGSLSGELSLSTGRGLRPGSPATERYGCSARRTTSSPIR